MNRMIGRMSHRRVSGAALLGLAASAMLLLAGRARAQDIYRKPPNEILKVLNAPCDATSERRARARHGVALLARALSAHCGCRAAF